MDRRTSLALLLVPALLTSMSACGSDDVDVPGAQLPSTPASSPEEPPPAPTSPSESPEFSLEFGFYGGFTTREVSFQMQPALLVTTDGEVIQPGPVAEIYPGPLLPADFVRTITPEGIDRLIAELDEAGMLADVTYERNDNIADAGTATLVVELDGETYRHEAYALGIGGPPGESSEDSPDRDAFAQFAERLTNLADLVGAENLGPETPYVPDVYQMIAFPAGDLTGYEVEPTIVEWPATTGITLAELSDCTEVAREAVGTLFDDATQLTFFSEADVVYSVVPRPAYPGRTCP